MAGDEAARLRPRAGTGAMLATTIALVAVVGVSLVRFPFGSSHATEPAERPRAVASATLAGSIHSETVPSAAPVSTHEVEIVTRPAGARVQIASVDGTGAHITGSSPLTATVDAGPIDVRVTVHGHETRTQRITVTRDRRVTWWLEPEGSLHRKVTQFKTGAPPKQVAFHPDGTQVWVGLETGDLLDAIVGGRAGEHRSDLIK